MINTVYRLTHRSQLMFASGCREAFREIRSLPAIFYRAIYEFPQHFPTMLRSMPYMLITAIPLGLYDRNFGSMLVNSFIKEPVRGFCWLIYDPVRVLPIALKKLTFTATVAVIAIVVGLIFGMILRIAISGTYGFVKGVIEGYSLPL